MKRKGGPAGTGQAALVPPGEGRRGQEGHIGYLLRQAQGAFRQAGDTALAEIGLTLPQYGVLSWLVIQGPLSGAALARLSMQTPQTLDAVIKNLERSGLVARTPDPLHGRILHVALTDEGRSRAAAARRRIDGLERRLVSGLKTDEERVIRAWLAAVARDLLPR
jgi:DNA-binding MarR family transcriptional regulator